MTCWARACAFARAERHTSELVTPTSSEFPEADRIVDELLDRRRVFLFWPGTGSVVSVIMLHVVGVALWVGPTFFAAVPWLRSRGWVWEPLLIVALAVSLASVVIPSVLLTRGKRIGGVALRVVTASWLVAVGSSVSRVVEAHACSSYATHAPHDRYPPRAPR